MRAQIVCAAAMVANSWLPALSRSATRAWFIALIAFIVFIRSQDVEQHVEFFSRDRRASNVRIGQLFIHPFSIVTFTRAVGNVGLGCLLIVLRQICLPVDRRDAKLRRLTRRRMIGACSARGVSGAQGGNGFGARRFTLAQTHLHCHLAFENPNRNSRQSSLHRSDKGAKVVNLSIGEHKQRSAVAKATWTARTWNLKTRKRRHRLQWVADKLDICT